MNIINRIRRGAAKIAVLAVIASSVLAVPLAPTLVNASAQSEINKGVNAVDQGTSPNALPTLITNVINILLFIVGAAAVIMIIIGGIRYVTSGGDQSAITSAKNTILYSIVGLVVAAMAFAIVNFVVDAL